MKNRKEFFEYIAKNKFTVVKFTAKWCNPCKNCQPLVEECLKLLPGVDFITIDIDDNTGINSYYRVKAVPTFWAFRYKDPMFTAEGSDEKIILDFFQKVADEYSKK